MQRYVKAVKSRGNLKLVLNPEAREDLLDLARRMNLRERGTVGGESISTGDAEAEVLEDLIANGFQNIEPGDVGALTSAPMITDDFESDEVTGESVPSVGGRVYAYMDYQVRSFVDDLAERGESLWIGAKVTKAAGK